MKTKKIMVITDSLSLPRAEVKYEDTWIYLMKRDFPDYDIIVRSEKGAMTSRLVTEGGGGIDLLELYEPHLVILQMGITECAPRLFKKHGLEHLFLTRILTNKLRNRYINYVRKTRERNPKIPYIKPEIFRANLVSYLDRAQKLNTGIIIISILKANDSFTEKSPHIESNINQYNSIYKELASNYDNVQFIDPIGDDVDINKITIDEVHITAEGNKIFYSNLKPLLKS